MKRKSLHRRTYRLSSSLLTFLMLASLASQPFVALAQTRGRDRTRAVEKSQASNPDSLIPSTVFTNASAINIPDSSASSIQSNITVSGLSGTISSVAVTLTNFTASAGGGDFDILLVGPGGQKFIVFSDVGGLFDPITNATVTLNDSAGSLLPSSGSVATGTFKPTDYGADLNLPSPAPVGPYSTPATAGAATFTSTFGGLSGASVNGTWSLFVADDTGSGGTGATIAGGWSIDITTAAASPTTTTIMSSLNPSFTNQAVTFTSTTTSTSTVNTGTVTFVDNTTAVTLCSNVAVNGSGVATCLVPANTLAERRHTIQATYNGNATFSTSNGSLTQTVNFPTSQVGNTFTNAGGINIQDTPSTSIPYPSNIIVSGLSGTISKVTLTLTNASFGQTADENFLLVGPTGQTFVFMSDAGGLFSVTSNATLTFDDAAGSSLPNTGSLASGTYRPTDYASDVDVFPAPAPASPYNTAAPNGVATFASVFGGAAPNGTWSLYPVDDTGGGTGTIASWSLTFTTTGDAPTTTVVSGNPNPSTTAQTVLFTATVTSGGNPVTVGTVTFREGATILCASVALNGSGQATCNTGPFVQGDHVITADYNGAPGQFNISSGNVTQQVNSPTVVTCLNFANNGGLTIPNASFSNPYPSRILVTGLGGTISKVTLTLNNLTTPTPDDADLLLVGPGGQKFLFMSDAGGANVLNNVTITLDDAAGNQLPDSTAITSGTWRPASYVGGADTFPAPAPVGPYNPPAPEGAGTFASVFNGISPNGTWSLYAIEDAGDAVNTTLTGWSLTFTLAAVNTTTAVTSNANPSVFGQPVTFTATVTTAALGIPSGNVQFFDGATPIGGPVALNGSGQAALTTSSLTVTNHTITAQYAGAATACNGTFNSSTGSLAGNPQVVNKASTTTGIASSSNPVATGVPVTFTVTVSPVAPGAGTRTGTVDVLRFSQVICNDVPINVSGQATCNMTFTVPGTYDISSSYSGDGNFNSSASSVLSQSAVGPTAANVNIAGRVFDANGRGLSGARVSLQNQQGQTIWAITNPFGYYQFFGVEGGQLYLVSVIDKRYQFEPRAITAVEDVTGFDFTPTSNAAVRSDETIKTSRRSP